MTRGEQADRDVELRARLEQIAASAGSPPEHGLVRVAELRRRRTRHRRGAVAATMALAVSGALVVTLRSGDAGSDPDVAMSRSSGGAPWQAALPDELHVQCSPEGIDVPVAFIRPREDGLHLRVENDGGRSVDLTVEAETDEPLAWHSGEVEVEPGETGLVQPVPPGRVTVTCGSGDPGSGDAEDAGATEDPRGVGGPGESREVNVVDVDEVYEEAELSCPSYRQVVPDEDEVDLEDEVDDRETAVTRALSAYFDEEIDEVDPRTSYPDQDVTVPTRDPVMEVLRDDEPVAWVALAGDEEGPWAEARILTVCQDYVTISEGDDSGDSGGSDDSEGSDDAGGSDGDGGDSEESDGDDSGDGDDGSDDNPDGTGDTAES